MKKSSAMVLSLFLLWAQVFVVVQPAEADAPAKSGCCSCKRNCCVTPSDSSKSAPQAAVPAQSAPLDSAQFALAAAPTWLLPRGAAAISPPASVSSLSATRVPLFRRDCALLI